ncbi:ABC transporter substrate-binding protein [Bradyrhizobium sp. STM 3561]|uniref:ABC transporter substrate-binding protein n=1 Tax=Bradyrhizobium sp. STM 3561 TaxID=578923 RepID=UPI00388E7594
MEEIRRGRSVFAAYSAATLAQSKSIPKVGIVGSLNQRAIDEFKGGLRDFGLIDGDSVLVVGNPASAASPQAVSRTVSDFISQGMNVIFASGAVAGKAAKSATSTIPIVCLTGDLVKAGLVKSLASPGGNLTGISILTAEASAKRLELLIQIVPTLERAAVFYNFDDPTASLSVEPTKAAAAKMQVRLQVIGVHGQSDFPSALAAAVNANVQAIALTSNPLFDIAGQQIAELALQNKLATVSFADSFPEVGGLLSYGPSIFAEYHHAAHFAARIIRGAKPADLPVEHTTIYKLGINLKTARALNLKVPEMLLASADTVIE